MNYKIFFLFALILCLKAYPVQAYNEAIEVPDGPTAPTTLVPSVPDGDAGTVAALVTTKTGAVAYNPAASTPPCNNTTCINAQTIFNAKHGYVGDSSVKSYVTLLRPAIDENKCQTPTMTGMTMNRQRVEGDKGKIVKYDDGFCLNQGCVYFNDNGDKKCE